MSIKTKFLLFCTWLDRSYILYSLTGMYSGSTGIFSNTPSWKPSVHPATNTASSLSSLEIPGFQSSQSQTRTLNQMKPMQGPVTAPSNLGKNNVL